MRQPEQLTDIESKCLDELCECDSVLTMTMHYARVLAATVRDRRGEHLAIDVRPVNGQRELRTPTAGICRDRAAVLAAMKLVPRQATRQKYVAS
ncbi:hypothetical protein [Streptomyces sp. NPDC088847]|uniref:hypothetical protein n=1 Tax=Streptomyces sp. NPDC088847 TaxID=3365909 RepID=UPI003809440A